VGVPNEKAPRSLHLSHYETNHTELSFRRGNTRSMNGVLRVPPPQHHISHFLPHHSCIPRSPPTSYQSSGPPPFMYFAFPSNIISVACSPTIHVFRVPLQHHISHLVPHHSCISRSPPSILSVIFSPPIHVFLVPLQHHISHLVPHHSCISRSPPTSYQSSGPPPFMYFAFPFNIISVIWSPTIHVFRVPRPTSYQSFSPYPFMYFSFPSSIISVACSPTIHVFRLSLQQRQRGGGCYATGVGDTVLILSLVRV